MIQSLGLLGTYFDAVPVEFKIFFTLIQNLESVSYHVKFFMLKTSPWNCDKTQRAEAR